MRSPAPDLMPLFRSTHQAQVLAWLYLHPGEECTATQLAERFGVALTTIHREVQRLVDAGLLEERSVGRSRLFRAATSHRAVAPLTQLLALSFGPLVVVGEAFAPVRGVQSVHIYGSWAARYSGEPGPPPADVDVLVVGEPSRGDVCGAADDVQERLGLPVNPTIHTVEEWSNPSYTLVQQIKASPFITVLEFPV